MEPIRDEVRKAFLEVNPDFTEEDLRLYERLRAEAFSFHPNLSQEDRNRRMQRASKVHEQLIGLHSRMLGANPIPTDLSDLTVKKASKLSHFSLANRLPVVALAFSLLGVVIFGIWLKSWYGLPISISLQDLTPKLAPLALAAAFIERAVEIIISPWRDAEANKLQKIVAAINARPPDPMGAARSARDLRNASDRLDEYRGETQRIAFAVSMIFSIFVSIAGFRGLEQFVDVQKFQNTIPHPQELLFLCVDVALSALLLSGGADGIHSVVNAMTTFFQSSADKAKQTS
jgi:hypothetical protein